MLNKHKLYQVNDLQEFIKLENEMLMSYAEYKAHLKCLRLCSYDTRKSEDVEEHKFYLGLIKELKDDMREQLNWLDSEERYQLMECLAQSDFVKSIFKMKRGDE